jgi:hypothetical protein
MENKNIELDKNITSKVTRIEVIDENGRSYVNWKEDNKIKVLFQDNNRTMKIFITTTKPK